MGVGVDGGGDDDDDLGPLLRERVGNGGVQRQTEIKLGQGYHGGDGECKKTV